MVYVKLWVMNSRLIFFFYTPDSETYQRSCLIMKKVLFVLVAIICVVGVVKTVEVVANRNQPSVKDMMKQHIMTENVIKERVLNETRR